MRLKGLTALITGGGTGIGRATALLFAKEGAGVAVNYSKSQDKAEEVARLAREMGVKAMAIRADVSKDSEARALVEKVVAEFGRLDILVNNAGFTRRVDHRDLEALTEEIWDRTFDVNLKGAFYCARAAIPVMKRQGGGSIINVASVAGLTGFGSSIAYCASKAGMISLTKSLARAFSPEIRVNAIAPGFIETGFVNWEPEIVERSRRTNPLGRNFQPEEVAEAALFLAVTSALTGQTIMVDGGLTVLGPKF